MPTSQSASLRQRALSYRASYSAAGFNSVKPCRMAASVMDEIHSRSTGLVQPVIR